MYTLTLCLGMFLGVCGQVRTFDYSNAADCEKERAYHIKAVGNGYAVCAPKKLNEK